MPIFDNSGRLKIFTSLNKVEGSFEKLSFFEQFFCTIWSKLEDLFLEINLAQVSSLPILKIYGNGGADIILGGGGACTYFFYIDGIFRWEA